MIPRAMHESVLAHVAKADPQKENLATAALTYILNRSEPCLRAFQALVENAIGPVAAIRAVRTEETIDEAKRPDVLLVGRDGARVGFMEVKFWAGLTDAQPAAYLKQLAADPAGIFVVLAPRRRLQSLRNELVTRCEASSLQLVPGSDTALTCGTTQVALLAWSELLDRLATAALDERRSAADLDQLRGLCESIEADGFLPLTREDLDDVASARRYLMLADLADEIVDRLTALGLASTKGLKATPLPHGYGRYVALPQAGFWIGVDHESWARHGRGPLWIRFPDGKWGRGAQVTEALRAWTRVCPPRAYRDDELEKLFLPVPLRPGASKEEMLADVVQLFHAVTAALTASGMSESESWNAGDPAT